MQYYALQCCNAFDIVCQNAVHIHIFMQYFERPLKVTEKGTTEHACVWTVAGNFGWSFRTSLYLNPLILEMMEKSPAFLFFNFLQVMRTNKKNWLLTQKNQEVSVYFVVHSSFLLSFPWSDFYITQKGKIGESLLSLIHIYFNSPLHSHLFFSHCIELMNIIMVDNINKISSWKKLVKPVLLPLGLLFSLTAYTMKTIILFNT